MGFNLWRPKRYELEKIRFPRLRGRMHFLRLDCHGADKGAQQFGVSDRNARRFGATFDCPIADAERCDARPDGTDANAARSNDEFSAGPSTF